MHRQQFVLNDIFSDTISPMALIFGMKHCLEELLQVNSAGGPGVQNGSAAGVLGFENKIYFKIFSRTAGLRCLKFGM